jgi:hypothetical protein
MSPLFIAFWIGAFSLCVFLDLVNQYTYQRKKISEIKSGFNRTVLKIFLGFVVMVISSLIWWHMGWKDGQPIHWPWRSN